MSNKTPMQTETDKKVLSNMWHLCWNSTTTGLGTRWIGPNLFYLD